MEFKDAKTIKEVTDAITKIKKLEKQKITPTRDGMIDALTDAKNTAPAEITITEISQGDTHFMPFANFSDVDLYRKLTQYQQGLISACIQKVGQRQFEKMMNGEV